MNGTFDSAHLAAFKEHVPEVVNFPEEEGGAPRLFGEKNKVTGIRNKFLPNNAANRAHILKMSKCKDQPIKELCCTIFAWGGMNASNARNLFSMNQDDWLTLCSQIREGNYSRADAYAEFRALRAHNKCKGMGPAYFTKLIYFLMPRGEKKKRPGYIMDQWVGCSINLLAGDNVVLMNTSSSLNWTLRKRPSHSKVFTVSDANDHENFECYCRQIEAVAKEIKKSPEQAEWLMVSRGGHNPEPWRKYVKCHRKVFR